MSGNNFLSHKSWYQRQVIAAIILLVSIIPVTTYAQHTIIVGSGFQDTPLYTQQQLDQMLAPIALYPDTLIAQILVASTYPFEVVQASRWLQQPANSSLKGGRLAEALELQPWNPSVKSLVVFPQVINMMDSNLGWTEQLGDAFLANQPAVMDSVQRLRWKAQLAGTLRSTSQHRVLIKNQDIIIEPVSPQIVYVPSYNPSVYGNWPYPDYPPFYFNPPANVVYYNEPLVNYGIGVVTIPSLWAREHWDWNHRRIITDNRHFHHKHHKHKYDHDHARNRPPPATVGVLHHNPAHRHGFQHREQFHHGSRERIRDNQRFDEKHRVHSRSRPEKANSSEPVGRDRAFTNQPVKGVEGKMPAEHRTHRKEHREERRVIQPQNKIEVKQLERAPTKSSPNVDVRERVVRVPHNPESGQVYKRYNPEEKE